MLKSEVGKWSDFNLGRPLFYTQGCEDYDRNMARALHYAIQGRDRIVELGAGDGLWIEYLARNYPAKTFIAVEWNEKLLNYAMLNRCLGLKNVRFIHEDASLPEALAECDFFYGFGFIEHFSKSEEVLKMWVDKLTPGGGCILTAPNILAEDWLINRCKIDPKTVKGLEIFATDSYGYEELWTPNYFLNIIMNVGLEVLEYRWLNELPDQAHYVHAIKKESVDSKLEEHK